MVPVTGKKNNPVTGKSVLSSISQSEALISFTRWRWGCAMKIALEAFTKAQAAKAQAVQELELIHNGYLNQIMPQHNWIMATPLEQRKNLRTHALRLWINCSKPALEESYKTNLEKA